MKLRNYWVRIKAWAKRNSRTEKTTSDTYLVMLLTLVWGLMLVSGMSIYSSDGDEILNFDSTFWNILGAALIWSTSFKVATCYYLYKNRTKKG